MFIRFCRRETLKGLLGKKQICRRETLKGLLGKNSLFASYSIGNGIHLFFEIQAIYRESA
jgi:hypothetical protein